MAFLANPFSLAVPTLTAEELETLLPGFQGVVLDVREPIEGTTQGTLPGPQINIPLRDLSQKAPIQLNFGQEIITYCAHGVRSREAVKILSQLGFQKCRSLEGGLAAWQARQRPRG